MFDSAQGEISYKKKSLYFTIFLFLVAFLFPETVYGQTLALKLQHSAVMVGVGHVTLQQGQYAQNGVSVRLFEVLEQDLNGDTEPDAVALVVTTKSETSSEKMWELLAFTSSRGVPVQLAARTLGKNIAVDRFDIDENNNIVLELRRHGEADTACCPSVKLTERYRLSDDTLSLLIDDAIFLQNLYEGNYVLPDELGGKQVYLANGRYGSSTWSLESPLKVFLSHYSVLDFDADGDNDVVLILHVKQGRQDSHVLFWMQNDGHEAVQVAARQLEPDIRIERLITDGYKIDIELFKRDNDDPACCPRTRVTQTYILENDIPIFLDEVAAAPPLNFQVQEDAP